MTTQFEKHKRNWEDLGKLDPLWAICTLRDRQYGRWSVDDFFRTGKEDLDELMKCVDKLDWPARRDVALDFGCGVGRLTRALAGYFKQCYGVDISDNMINQARELNREFTNCEFVVNAEDRLPMFPDNRFDLIYSKVVLQHLPSRSLIKQYLAEFVRILRPDGLLVFQARTRLTVKAWLQPRRRWYVLLRSMGFQEKFLYEKLRLNPMKMTDIPEAEVKACLQDNGAEVIRTEHYTVSSGDGAIYYVTKAR